VRRGRHAADDGSFGRSSGMAAGRAAALLGVAVVMGIVLLNAADDSPSRRVSAGGDTSSTTSAPEETTTTSGVATTTVPARAPKEVKVLSANGTDVKGAARKATDALRAAGFNVLAPVDAGKPVPATGVFFTAGFEREAQVVASLLGVGADVVKPLPTPPPVADVRGANVVVVVGPEAAARLVGPSAAPPITRAGATASTTTTTTKP
jgi:hypothetical protein